MKMNPSRVNILMPFYNAQAFIKESVESLFAQTQKNWELIAVDDGSTDASCAILSEYKDPRIKIFSHKTNKGLSNSFNNGLDQCSSEYIARMDADDRAHPSRLEKQLAFMDKNPAISVCGTAAKKFGAGSGMLYRVETDSDRIRCKLLFDSQLVHPSVVIRRSVIIQEGLAYRADYEPADDYDLWIRIARKHPLGNLPEMLLDYRIHSGQTMSLQQDRRKKSVEKIHGELIQEIGLDVTPENLFIHELIRNIHLRNAGDHLVAAENWLCNLSEANLKTHIYPQQALKSVLGEMLFNVCYRSSDRGKKAWANWKKSELRVFPYPHPLDYAKWLVKCAMAEFKK